MCVTCSTCYNRFQLFKNRALIAAHYFNLIQKSCKIIKRYGTLLIYALTYLILIYLMLNETMKKKNIIRKLKT